MTTTGSILLIVLLAVFVVFMVYSAILLYHWFKYSMSTAATFAAIVLYMTVSFILFFIMASAMSAVL